MFHVRRRNSISVRTDLSVRIPNHTESKETTAVHPAAEAVEAFTAEAALMAAVAVIDNIRQHRTKTT
jgi:hypothetical protein